MLHKQFRFLCPNGKYNVFLEADAVPIKVLTITNYEILYSKLLDLYVDPILIPHFQSEMSPGAANLG